jgi:hypothetical protein
LELKKGGYLDMLVVALGVLLEVLALLVGDRGLLVLLKDADLLGLLRLTWRTRLDGLIFFCGSF